MGRYIIFGGILGFFLGYFVFFVFGQDLSTILLKAFPNYLVGPFYPRTGSPASVLLNFIPGIVAFIGAVIGFILYIVIRLFNR